MKTSDHKKNLDFDYEYGFSMPENYKYKARKGLSVEIIKKISEIKNEPDWVLNFRLKAYEAFRKRSMPQWGPDLSEIDFNKVHYYVKPTDRTVSSWDELPSEIKETYEKIGVPEAERDFLAGVSAQYDSEIVYENYNKELRKKGVIFCSIDGAIQDYPDLVKGYLGKLISVYDNKFAALNSAVFSGGTFIYFPPGVKVDTPLQSYFRINAREFGQFERTLIIADKGSSINYIEGCTAPIYRRWSLHAAVVEVFVHENSKVSYTTVQNWSKDIYNLATKRASVETDGVIEWIDCNLGSKVNMKYPSAYLKGEGARGEMLSISLAGKGQIQDAGAKMIHFAKNTSSHILSKSISKDGGLSSYRGLVQVMPGAENSSSFVSCSALILDKDSRATTYPTIRTKTKNCRVQHEASVSKVDEEILFYLQSRGVEKEEAESMIVNGFLEPVTKRLPLGHLIELKRLINLEMRGEVG